MKMKLYEFTFTDNQNLTETEIIEDLKEFLLSESEVQGWANGYNLRQCKDIQHLPSGQRQLTFEVLGEYVDSSTIDFDQEMQGHQEPNKSFAAKEAAP